MQRRIIIVGGGIAGLASARALARRPGFGVTLLERENTLCQHASGHNAAIFRPLEADAALAALAERSRAAFVELEPSRALLDARGFVLLHSDRDVLATVQVGAGAGGVESRLVSPDELAGVLRGSMSPDGYHGLLATSGGILDVHQLGQALARAARSAGAQIVGDSEVTGLLTEAGRVRGVVTARGEVPADTVVIAGGAWSSTLGREMGVPLELRRVRRHLALLESEKRLPTDFPVVWCLEPEVYFRQELDRVLVSPCDATVVDGTLAQTDIDALSPLWEKLARLGTGLEHARVSRHWACLRTFAPDDRPVIGPDPRIDGLAWLVGLGGFGMTTGVAAGEELARALAADAESEHFSVSRLLSARS